jgi:plasmid stabilization system protein ParE
MSLSITVAPGAAAQIEEINTWWRQNRQASPGLFAEELAAAFGTLSAMPEAGHRYTHTAVPGVRRLLLRACRHHVYYVPGVQTIAVLAVWSSVRGAGPPLR